jgi:hypothetical protein
LKHKQSVTLNMFDFSKFSVNNPTIKQRFHM